MYELLNKIIIFYEKNPQSNLSSTLNSIKLCYKDRYNISLGMIAKIPKSQKYDDTLLYKYLIDCINKEIELGKEYHLFYTAQSFGKYVSSRMIDYLLYEGTVDGDNKPIYNFYKGVPSRKSSNYTVGGKYENMNEYMKFIQNFFKLENDKASGMSEEGKKNFYDNLKPAGISAKEIFGIEESEFDDINYIIADSLDKRGSELEKNVYSLNNTALGNTFKNQSIGESTPSFLYSKYGENYNALASQKYLEKDINNIIKIDSSKLSDILTRFSLDMQIFYNTYISNVDSRYKTRNGIVFQIGIKKEKIYKYIIPTIGYALPLRTKLEEGSFERDYKIQINKYFEDIRKSNIELETIKRSVDELLINNYEYIKKYIKKDIENDESVCNYITGIQSRAVITNEWINSLKKKNNDIIINVFPCNYNDKKDECIDFVRELDNIIYKYTYEIKKEFLFNFQKVNEANLKLLNIRDNKLPPILTFRNKNRIEIKIYTNGIKNIRINEKIINEIVKKNIRSILLHSSNIDSFKYSKCNISRNKCFAVGEIFNVIYNDFKNKYLKYKTKYSELKNLIANQ